MTMKQNTGKTHTDKPLLMKLSKEKSNQMNLSKLIIFFLLMLISSFSIQSQNINFPLGHDFSQKLNTDINKLEVSINTGFKPLLKSDFNIYKDFDSLLYQYNRTENFFKKRKNRWIWRKLFFEDFFYIKKKNLRLSINPVLYLQYGRLTDTSSTFTLNTRGLEIKGDLGKKISFYSSFRENQAFFRPYIDDIVNERQVVPGQGATKTFKEQGHDYSMSTGYVSFSPIKSINIQLGYDKNFIGEGYRSLLLSDNAFNYPFLKLSFNFLGFKYVTLFTQFEDFDGRYYDYHTKKHGAFNYLSYSFRNRIEIGLFEGIIYRTTDTTAGYINKIPYDYFIPIIGIRTGTYGMSGANNALWGVNLKVKITDFIQVYGQTAIDDNKFKKYACQAGLKVFDIFHSKIKNMNLYFQAEYNNANSGIYSHQNLKYQTWSHFNQELAHPSGSGFSELLGILKYSWKNIFLEIKYNSAEINKDKKKSNIHYTDDYIYTEFPTTVKITHKIITAAWTINPRTNLQLYGGVDIRAYTGQKSKNFIFFGLRTNINNFYYDF